MFIKKNILSANHVALQAHHFISFTSNQTIISKKNKYQMPFF